MRLEIKATLVQLENLASLVRQEGLVLQDLQEKLEKMDYL